MNLYSKNFIIGKDVLKLLLNNKITFIPSFEDKKNNIKDIYMKFEDKNKYNKIKEMYTSDSNILVLFKNSIYEQILFDKNFNIQSFILNNSFYSKIKKFDSINNKKIIASTFEEFCKKIETSLNLYKLHSDKELISISNNEFNEKIDIIKELYKNKDNYYKIINNLQFFAYEQNDFFISMFYETERSNSKSYDSHNIQQLLYLKTILNKFKNNKFILGYKENISIIENLKGLV